MAEVWLILDVENIGVYAIENDTGFVMSRVRFNMMDIAEGGNDHSKLGSIRIVTQSHPSTEIGQRYA